VVDINYPHLDRSSETQTEIKESNAENFGTNNIDGDGHKSIQGTDICGVIGNRNNFVKIDKAYFNSSCNLSNTIKNDLITNLISEEKATKSISEFILAGSFDDINENKIKAIQALLRKIAPDTELIIQKVEEGSIKVTVEAKIETLELLKALFKSGELTELLEFSIENVRILSQDVSNIDKSSDLVEKSRLIQEIVSFPRSNKQLSGADLWGANLSGADLSRANFCRANLRRANLIEANLIEANLIEANLSYINLWRADLSRADLSGADLSRANLSGANLSGANLSGANLLGAVLDRANLSGANLSRANLSGANLNEARLDGADLSGAILRGTVLSGTVLHEVVVAKAVFTDTVGLQEAERDKLEKKGAKVYTKKPMQGAIECYIQQI
jgi:uncharacterized protein YjbI with pentapeptide repeats